MHQDRHSSFGSQEATLCMLCVANCQHRGITGVSSLPPPYLRIMRYWRILIAALPLRFATVVVPARKIFPMIIYEVLK